LTVMESKGPEDPERLREQIQSLESLRGVLDDAVIDQKKAALEARLRALDTGGGAHVGGGVTTGGGKFVGRDDHSKTEQHHHYHGATPIDPARTEETYRRCIADRCKDLPLQDVGDLPTGGEKRIAESGGGLHRFGYPPERPG
jgi:hypothetical protein